jgi:hypothetical protein
MDNVTNDELSKKVDESWKDAVKNEKPGPAGEEREERVDVSFGLFISSLAMQSMVALGDVENPISKKKEFSKVHAQFLIDTLAMLKEKTNNNLSKEEAEMLEGMLYELRMRFVAKTSKIEKV